MPMCFEHNCTFFGGYTWQRNHTFSVLK